MAESSEKSGESGITSVLNVIPSIYYDIIARICPGLAFYVALFVSWPDSTNHFSFPKLESFGAGSVFLLIVFGYVAGMVLTGFSFLWDLFSFLALSCLPRRLSSAIGLVSGLNPVDQWRRVADRMEALAKENVESGRTVAKALAEVALCQNLLTGAIALALLGHFSAGRLFFAPMEHLAIVVCAVAVFLVAALFRQTMFLGRVEALHHVYIDDVAWPRFVLKLPVRDWRESRKWYEDIGLEVVDRESEQQRAVLRDQRGATLVLLPSDYCANAAAGILYFRVSLSAEKQKVLGASAKWFPWGYGIEIRDPNGYLVRLWEQLAELTHR